MDNGEEKQMADNVVKLPGQETPDMRGPDRMGSAVIIEGRKIPNLHMHDLGDTIDFILDERLSFEFPKEWAYLAATMAANAMAIGAGYSFLGAESKDRPFALQCIQLAEVPKP